MTCTKYDVMAKIRALDREKVDELLYDALMLADAYGEAEGYYPRAASEEVGRLRELLNMVAS